MLLQVLDFSIDSNVLDSLKALKKGTYLFVVRNMNLLNVATLPTKLITSFGLRMVSSRL